MTPIDLRRLTHAAAIVDEAAGMTSEPWMRTMLHAAAEKIRLTLAPEIAPDSDSLARDLATAAQPYHCCGAAPQFVVTDDSEADMAIGGAE